MFELRVKTWLNDKEVLDRVQKATVKRVAKCALIVEAEAKRLLSKGGKKLATAQFGDKKVPVTYESGPAGDPPRIRTGNLRSSIRSAPTEQGTYVVGPTTTAWYGRVHEFGALVKVTAKMRGFLLHQFGWRLKPSTTHIYIPPRPFMRPALENMVKKFPEQFKDLPLAGGGA